MQPHRRSFLRASSAQLLSLSLIGMMNRRGWACDQGRDEITAWFAEYASIGERLREAPERQARWQLEMDELFTRVPMRKLLQYFDFSKLADDMTQEIGTAGELFVPIAVNGVSGAIRGAEPEKILLAKMAYVKKGKAIPPRGHSNMVSAFLNISGQFHVRQYDRLQVTDDSMLVRETCNRVCGVGEWSSISDERNNVHWLTAVSEDCFLFTTKMIKIVDGRDFHGRVNIDILDAKSLGNSLLMAPRISHQQAAEKY